MACFDRLSEILRIELQIVTKNILNRIKKPIDDYDWYCDESENQSQSKMDSVDDVDNYITFYDEAVV